MNWFQSWVEYSKEKINNPLYFTFVISIIAWNWKSFYVLFWMNTEKLFGVTQLEYALFVSRKIIYGNEWYVDILNHLWFFAVPCIVTYFAVWYLPLLHNKAHVKYLKFRFDRELEYVKQNTIFEEAKRREIKQQLKVVEEIASDTKEIFKIKEETPQLSQEDRWSLEYKNRIEVLKDILMRLPEFIYKFEGYIFNDGERRISVDDLAILDTNDLIVYNGTNQVSLTTKGKFFLALLLNKVN